MHFCEFHRRTAACKFFIIMLFQDLKVHQCWSGSMTVEKVFSNSHKKICADQAHELLKYIDSRSLGVDTGHVLGLWLRWH